VLGCWAHPWNATNFEGHLAFFKVAGTLARLELPSLFPTIKTHYSSPSVLEPSKNHHFNIYHQPQERMAAALAEQLDVAQGPFPNLSFDQTAATNLSDAEHPYIRLGLQGVKRQKYTSTVSFKTAIMLQTDEMRSSNASQYAVFALVTKD